MTFRRRKRLLEIERAEAAGESFWTDELSSEVRHKLAYAVADLLAQNTGTPISIMKQARAQVLRDEGLPYLSGPKDVEGDIGDCLGQSETDLVLSIMEAILAQTEAVSSATGSVIVDPRFRLLLEDRLPIFRSTIKQVLREHRVSFGLVEDRFVPIESTAMHANVVAPTVSLLAGRSDLVNVETAYRNALDEIASGKPEDAITDAGTALQEMLDALGCEGNSLGRKLQRAKDLGLLAPHDSPMADAVKKVGDWVSADRSNSGDGHNATEVRPEDAWFTVNVVGALILRLAEGTGRG